MKFDGYLEDHEKLTWALLLIVLAFFAFWYWVTNRTPTVTNYPNDRTTVVAFGDSLIEGVGSSDGGFVTDLEEILNYDITNLGVSGNTTFQGLARINEVLRLEPKLVIISLGGNDFIQRVNREHAAHNLNKLISQLQNTGSMVVLLEVPGYRKLYKDIAHAQNSGYVSNILSGIITKDKYMSDPIHPNDAGYQKIAEHVAPTIKKLLEPPQ